MLMKKWLEEKADFHIYVAQSKFPVLTVSKAPADDLTFEFKVSFVLVGPLCLANVLELWSSWQQRSLFTPKWILVWFTTVQIKVDHPEYLHLALWKIFVTLRSWNQIYQIPWNSLVSSKINGLNSAFKDNFSAN